MSGNFFLNTIARERGRGGKTEGKQGSGMGRVSQRETMDNTGKVLILVVCAFKMPTDSSITSFIVH